VELVVHQPTAQLYHVAATNTFPYQVWRRPARERIGVHIEPRQRRSITYREWHPVAVIEYGYVAPDPLHRKLCFGAGTIGSFPKYDMVTGQVQNVTPIPVRSTALSRRPD